MFEGGCCASFALCCNVSSGMRYIKHYIYIRSFNYVGQTPTKYARFQLMWSCEFEFFSWSLCQTAQTDSWAFFLLKNKVPGTVFFNFFSWNFLSYIILFLELSSLKKVPGNLFLKKKFLKIYALKKNLELFLKLSSLKNFLEIYSWKYIP